jgi:YD repeat-containing protein
VAPHRLAYDADGAFVEELLLAGHERDPAEDVCR